MANPLDQLIQQPGNPNALPQAPMPPGMAGPPPMGQPEMGGPQEMASPEQVEELKGLFSNVQNANSQLVTKQLVDRNEISLMRRQLLAKLFDLMQQAGVDPSNPEAVKQFLSELETQDPDLLQIFTTAFQDLQSGPLQGMVPGEEAPQGEGEEEMMGGGPMERFRNLSRTEPMSQEGAMQGGAMPEQGMGMPGVMPQ